MQFDSLLKTFFKASEGAFSEVTEREVYDSQITLTGPEADLAIDFCGEGNILRGNVRSNPDKALKTFKLFPYMTDVQLNLVFPKSTGSELRLYISEEGGFKPEAGQIWFIYRTDGDLCLGAMAPADWMQIQESEENETRFQDEVERAVREGRKPAPATRTTKAYRRDPAVAAQSLEQADFHCEVDPQHQTFTSGRTGKPFVEAHHLVPMKAQAEIEAPLDVTPNVYAVCPNCHATIHYGEPELRKQNVRLLYDRHAGIGETTGVTLEDTLEYYE